MNGLIEDGSFKTAMS